jgi:hypothetical protein
MRTPKYVFAVASGFLVLLAAIAVPTARADSYTPTFVCSGGCVSLPTAPVVSFTSTSSTTITETWDDVVFSVELSPSDQATDAYEWFGDYEANGYGYAAIIYDENDGLTSYSTVPIAIIGSGPTQAAADMGTLSFASIAAPEPSAFLLVLLGVGFVLLQRKRSPRSHATAT